MNKRAIFTTVLFVALGMGLVGCAQFDRMAIERSRQYPTAGEQVKYLVGEANVLFGMERFDDAINIAEYILQDLDSNSVEAREIIKTAEARIEEAELYQLIQPHYYFEDTAGVWKHEWWEIGIGWDDW